MFEDYICEKILRYASGDVEELNRVKQQMTMEAITQGTSTAAGVYNNATFY